MEAFLCAVLGELYDAAPIMLRDHLRNLVLVIAFPITVCCDLVIFCSTAAGVREPATSAISMFASLVCATYIFYTAATLLSSLGGFTAAAAAANDGFLGFKLMFDVRFAHDSFFELCLAWCLLVAKLAEVCVAIVLFHSIKVLTKLFS